MRRRFMFLRADADRIAELQALGKTLISNARRLVEATSRAHPNAGSPTETTEDALVVPSARLG